MVGPSEPLPFEELAIALGFSAQDLEANRAGRLADTQRVAIEQLIARHMTTRRRSAVVLRVISVVIGGWPAFGFGSALIRGSLNLDLVLLNACAGVFIALMFALTRKPTATLPTVPELVQWVVGPASYQRRPTPDADGPFDLYVAGWVFIWLAAGSTPVPPVFVSGVTYRIFFVVLDLRALAGPVERSWMRFPLLLSAERA